MMFKEEELNSRFTKLAVVIEDDIANTRAVYPVQVYQLVGAEVALRGFRPTYYRAQFRDLDLIARSPIELAAILKEHFSDSPLRWGLRIEKDAKAELAHAARTREIAKAALSAGAARRSARAR